MKAARKQSEIEGFVKGPLQQSFDAFQQKRQKSVSKADAKRTPLAPINGERTPRRRLVDSE